MMRARQIVATSGLIAVAVLQTIPAIKNKVPDPMPRRAGQQKPTGGER